MTLSYTISNLRWLNARSLIVLDTQERLHLIDVRTQNNLETLDMSRVGISYASSHFKGLSTGGNVSKVIINTTSIISNIINNFLLHNIGYGIGW